MQLHEIGRVAVADGSRSRPLDRVCYYIADDAREWLASNFHRHGQSPEWFWDAVNRQDMKVPWATLCLDAEYDIAGHIATVRLPRARISLMPYGQVPSPVADDYVPPVGIIMAATREDLALVVDRSPLFAAAWQVLESCAANRRWLVMLDPPPRDWLAKVTPTNRLLWLTRPRKPAASDQGGARHA